MSNFVPEIVITDSFISLCCPYDLTEAEVIFSDYLGSIRCFRYGYTVIAYDYLSGKVLAGISL